MSKNLKAAVLGAGNGGLATPLMDSIIRLASALLGKSLCKMGLQLSDLGLDKIGMQDLSHLMQGGE